MRFPFSPEISNACLHTMEYSVGLLEGVDLGSVLDDELVDVELPLATLVVHVPEENIRT